MNECKICGHKTIFFCKKKVLNKYVVKYYKCTNCDAIQTEDPYWLKEAYSDAIIDSDTGIIGRNIFLARLTAIFALIFRNSKMNFLDFAGGYGILTRCLRDIGIDCYWTDKYAENIFSKSFEIDPLSIYSSITAFEVLEHLEDPLETLKNIIKKYSPRVIYFSTMLHNGSPDKNWWYFAPHGGQHITLYSRKSLEVIALKLNKKLSTNNRNFHILSDHHIPDIVMKFLTILSPILSIFLPIFYKSKTFSDFEFISKK